MLSRKSQREGSKNYGTKPGVEWESGTWGTTTTTKKGGRSKKGEKEEGKGDVWKYGDREGEELKKNKNEE